MDEQDPTQQTADAEAAFASYLARVQRGESVDFETFLRERPTLAGPLRTLKEAWEARDAPSQSGAGSIREFLSRQYGADADPNIGLDPDAPSDPGSGVEERLKDLAARTGRYTLREEVARGGMGIILKVWDRDLRRTLAMKATASGLKVREGKPPSVDVVHVSRFLEEAQITGQLDHPGIVPVHELGVDDDGRMFFTMRMVKGITLDEVIKLARAEEEEWNRPRAVNVMVKVCEAMAYAHSKGVIHRDIKPANVMVGKFGEVYVMDWGLAKVIGRKDPHAGPHGASLMASRVLTDREDLSRTPDSPLVTLEGTIIGTPTYMPPEQAEGRIDDLDPRSDVYSVGALLYTLLTGRMPYVGPDEKVDGVTVLTRLTAGPPKPVQEIDKGVPPELVAICEKAMARKPADRYASMIEMADDLRAFVERRVVRAYQTGAVAEFRKWVGRNRAVAAAVAGLLVLAVGGAALFAWLQRERVQEVQRAQEATERARARAVTNARAAMENAEAARTNAVRAERQGYLAQLAAADASLRMNEPREAVRLLDACAERLRGWEWRHLRLSADTSRSVLRGHEDKVTAVAFGPKGARIVSGSDDRSVRVWDRETGRQLFELPGITDPVTALAYGPDGDRVAAASKDMIVRIYDVQAVRLVGTLAGHESLVRCLAFSGDGTVIATGDDEGARLWDAETFRKLADLDHGEPVRAIAFSPDGTRLATGTDIGVRLFDATSHEPVRAVELADAVTCLAYGETIAAGTLAGTVRILDSGGNVVRELAGHRDPVTAVRFAAGGTRVVSASYDKTIRVWDTATGEQRAVLRGHVEPVLAVDCEGSRVVSGAGDGTLRLWLPEDGLATLVLPAGEDFVNGVAFHPGGDRIAAGTQDGLRLWDAETGRPLAALQLEGGALSSVAYGPDGNRIVVGCEEDATARILDGDGKLVETLRGHEASVTSVAFSPDGTQVATASADRTVRLWDATTGEQLRVFEGHERRVASVAFGPEGRRVVSGSFDGTARLWDAASGEPLHVLRGHESAVLAVAFHPEGDRVATAGMDGRIRFWDASTGTAGFVLAGHADAVRALAFSPDGTRLVSGGHDKSVRVWAAETGDPLLRLRAHEGWVTAVAFDRDGARVATGSFDATAKIWRTSLPAPE